MAKAKEFQKNTYFCFIDYAKAVDHNKLWRILNEMVISDCLTCFLRISVQATEPYMEQWTSSKLWKEARQGYVLSPCLFNFCAEYFMWNAGLDESQAGIKIAGRNINNLKYADDTMLMAESKEELKSLLMKVKEESVNLS